LGLHEIVLHQKTSSQFHQPNHAVELGRYQIGNIIVRSRFNWGVFFPPLPAVMKSPDEQRLVWCINRRGAKMTTSPFSPPHQNRDSQKPLLPRDLSLGARFFFDFPTRREQSRTVGKLDSGRKTPGAGLRQDDGRVLDYFYTAVLMPSA
jgi:hypothetical protein